MKISDNGTLWEGGNVKANSERKVKGYLNMNTKDFLGNIIINWGTFKAYAPSHS